MKTTRRLRIGSNNITTYIKKSLTRLIPPGNGFIRQIQAYINRKIKNTITSKRDPLIVKKITLKTKKCK
jgi:hypothetical protein